MKTLNFSENVVTCFVVNDDKSERRFNNYLMHHSRSSGSDGVGYLSDAIICVYQDFSVNIADDLSTLDKTNKVHVKFDDKELDVELPENIAPNTEALLKTHIHDAMVTAGYDRSNCEIKLSFAQPELISFDTYWTRTNYKPNENRLLPKSQREILYKQINAYLRAQGDIYNKKEYISMREIEMLNYCLYMPKMHMVAYIKTLDAPELAILKDFCKIITIDNVLPMLMTDR